MNGPLVQYKNKVIWLTGRLGHVGKNFLERKRKNKRKEYANTLIYIEKLKGTYVWLHIKQGFL